MTQKSGWIKLHRELRYKFSNDKKLNFELWNLYVFLVEQSPWEDTREQKKGVLVMTAVDIQTQWFPNMYVRKIIRLLNRLNDSGYINMTRKSKANQDGYVIEIRDYDSILSEIDDNKCPSSVRRVSDECPKAVQHKESNSLNNISDEIFDCPSSVRRVSDECPTTDCSYYIEERNKKEETRINTFIEEPEAHRGIFDEIILDDVVEKKPKRPKKKKDVPSKSEPVITAYKEAYFNRYGIDPLVDVVVRSQACKIIDRVGIDDSANLIHFYLSHDDPFYLSKAHKLGICLSDVEKIYTEMKKGGYITKEYVDSCGRYKAKKSRI